jgi:hypothetical protein
LRPSEIVSKPKWVVPELSSCGDGFEAACCVWRIEQERHRYGCWFLYFAISRIRLALRVILDIELFMVGGWDVARVGFAI